MIEYLQDVQVGSTWYLGVLDEKALVVKLALEHRKDVKDTVSIWIQRQNLETLDTIQMAEGTGYVSRPLSVETRILLESEWQRMQAIREQVLRRLENEYFRKGRA